VAAFCRVGVLGDPLTFTLSPVLHRAGLEALGWSGESVAMRTRSEDLGARLAELSAAGWRGVNLTYPLKTVALDHLDRLSPASARARSVNTIGFGPEGLWGDTTDGSGFLDLLGVMGRDPRAQRVLLLGAGGAARSLATALADSGAAVAISARSPARVGAEGDSLGARLVGWRSAEEIEELVQATVVVNATFLAGRDGPLPVAEIPGGALVVDLVYGEAPTAWVREARARRLEACDGLGLLVFQARRSLSLWAEREVPLEPLLRAVGWPR